MFFFFRGEVLSGGVGLGVFILRTGQWFRGGEVVGKVRSCGAGFWRFGVKEGGEVLGIKRVWVELRSGEAEGWLWGW